MAIPNETHTLLRALEEVKPAQTFLQSLLITETDQSTSEYVDIDIIQGKRRLAPFVSPLSKSKVSLRVDGTTTSIKPPYIKVVRPISPQDLQKRLPGETPWSPMSLQQKLQILKTRDLADLRDQIIRRKEWMLAKQLFTGEVVIIGEGVNATLTLPMATGHELVNTDLVDNGWATAATAEPITDIAAIIKGIAKDSGLGASAAIFGDTAWAKFWASAQVQTLLDNQRIEITQGGALTLLGPTSGARFHGRIQGLDLYTYNEWYIDDSSLVEEPMVPDKKVAIISSGMRVLDKHGAIMDLDAIEGGQEQTTYAVPYFMKSWSEKDPSVHYVQIQSSPLPLIVQVNGFTYAQVIA